MGKKKNFFHRIQLILHYVLLLMRPNITHRRNKLTPGKSNHVWAWLSMHGHTQPAVVVLHAFFLGYYLYEKIYDIDCFFLEIFMIKESCNFIGRKHILVHNWNYVN